MATLVGTHDGGFHADDVLAFALIRVFHDADARIVRTRDLERLAELDIVIDVGAAYQPEALRFDHHQASYSGPLSSAGLVLAWLIESGSVSDELGETLRHDIVEYVDDVDTGRRAPAARVPCFARIVDTFVQGADRGPRGFEAAYLRAADMAQGIVEGIRAEHTRHVAARRAVVAEMAAAVSEGRTWLEFDDYVPWKGPYFENGGATHPTRFVVLPADESWRVICITVDRSSFENKRSLPEEWSGLTDADLARVVGVESARFCHKNRFLAIFGTRDDAFAALRSWKLL